MDTTTIRQKGNMSQHTTGSEAPPSDSPLLQVYFRDISRYPLISPNEEKRLAKKIEKGGSEGAVAFENMVTANLRLVVVIARRYVGLGLPLLDLINEGNIGLMTAVRRYRAGKKAKLSTYASIWIKQSIRRAVSDQGKTIRVPIHAGEKMRLIRNMVASFSHEFGREPSVKEISEATEVSENMVNLLLRTLPSVSLDEPLSYDADGISRGEIIPDRRATLASEEASRNEQAEVLWQILPTLSERELAIIKLRFGLNGYDPHTLEEIGAKFNVTRERIRQVEEKAIRKMRVRFAKAEKNIPSDTS